MRWEVMNDAFPWLVVGVLDCLQWASVREESGFMGNAVVFEYDFGGV